MANIKFVLFCLLIGEITPIFVKNGRYEDLYIIIQDNNEDNEVLLERIKEVFTAASKLLFTATRNHLYFGKIKVVVPKIWSVKTEYKRRILPSPSKMKQYVSVDNPGNRAGAFVRGLTKCGSGGSFMYLNSERHILTEGLKGDQDNVIVHEWGHLRYGLYDEYPVTKLNYTRFYQAAGKWYPVRCTNLIQGDVGMGARCEPSTECNTEDASKILNERCKFCPYREQNVDASLMGFQWIDALSMFCDKNDPATPVQERHNTLAPNKHNKLCNYRSAWEVMRQNEDFKNAVPLPRSTDTTPTFEFVQEDSKYRVFVLDVSGSMEGSKLETLSQTAKYVIQNLVPMGSWLAIITFSNDANVVKDLTEIKSQYVRDELKAVIPTDAYGKTCIGCGIEEAIRILKRKLSDASSGEIFVISDGKNNVGNFAYSKQKAVSENIIVHTISVTQDADILLADISKDTGGMHFTYLETGSVSFIAVFGELITNDVTSYSRHSAVLASERITTTPSNIVRFSFSIENGLGKDTSVTVLLQSHSSSSMQLRISGPNNYNETLNTTEKTATIMISGIAQAGDYEMTITMERSGQSVEYLVKSTPTNYDSLKISATLSATKIDFSSGEIPVIFAEVTKGFSPVLNVNVSARVETANGSRACDIYLYDEGMDPDGIDNDGIYSGYILPHCLYEGRVNTKVYASGRKGETIIMRGTSGSQTPYQDDKPEVFEDAFQRVKVLEDLYIKNYVDPDQNDTVPPGRITDVDIHHIVKQNSPSGESRNFTISWTATGDDKNVGQASAYILRISDDFETLLNDFDSAVLLDMKNISLSPQTSGRKEALKIVVDAEQSYTGTTFFALKAVDEAGNVGEISNILSIVVAKGYRAFGERGSFDDDVEAEEEDNMLIYVIIGASGGGLALLLIFITILLCRKRQFKKADDTNIHMGRI